MNKQYSLSGLQRLTSSAIVPADRLMPLKTAGSSMDYNIVSSANHAATSVSPGQIIITKNAKGITPVSLLFTKKIKDNV